MIARCNPFKHYTSFKDQKEDSLEIRNSYINHCITPSEGLFCNIFKLVLDPKRIVILDSEQENSFNAKLRNLIRVVKQFYNKSATPPLVQHTINCSLGKNFKWIHHLVMLILNSQAAQGDTVERARMALLSLEEIDPALAAINHQIDCFIHSSKFKERRKIDERLSRWLDKPKRTILPFPIRPHELQSFAPANHKMAGLISPIEQRKCHDLFWQIDGIAIGNSLYCLDNLRDIAGQENIVTIAQIPGQTWLRDGILVLDGNIVLVPIRFPIIRSPASAKDDERRMDQLVYALENARSLGMGRVAMEGTSVYLLQKGIPNIQEAPFYFEGGNLLPAVNMQGDLVYLSGSSNLLYSLVNSAVIFSEEKKKIALINEMKSVEGSPLFSKEKIAMIMEALERAGLLAEMDTDHKFFISKMTIASNRWIQKSMCATLKQPVVFLGDIFEGQPAFHLDFFLMPAPEGVVFVQDHLLCQQILETIRKTYSLTQKEKKRLLDYYRMTHQLNERYGAQLRKFSEDLQKAGFKVVPVPGVFYLNDTEVAVNFLNAIVGRGNKGRFCISNGSSHSLDRFLQDAFMAFLKPQWIDRVYYT